MLRARECARCCLFPSTRPGSVQTVRAPISACVQKANRDRCGQKRAARVAAPRGPCPPAATPRGPCPPAATPRGPGPSRRRTQGPVPLCCRTPCPPRFIFHFRTCTKGGHLVARCLTGLTAVHAEAALSAGTEGVEVGDGVVAMVRSQASTCDASHGWRRTWSSGMRWSGV